jgi:phenylacetate-CoA ligase
MTGLVIVGRARLCQLDSPSARTPLFRPRRRCSRCGKVRPVSLRAVDGRLNAIGGPILGGYPSVLIRLAVERQGGNLSVTPIVIVSTSETLYPHLRAAISAGFSVPVVDSFGCTEGLFGSSAPGAPVLTFNTDLRIAELVDAGNRPVKPGCPSAKVLLTNLHNRTQPLIRYELADAFVAEPDLAGAGLLRARVLGRADEVLHYPGVALHSHVIRTVLVRSPQVGDYQVRQTPGGIHLGILAARTPGILERIEASVLARRLPDALAKAGLADPEVRVRYVRDLERQKDRGKLSRFVPLRAR